MTERDTQFMYSTLMQEREREGEREKGGKGEGRKGVVGESTPYSRL